MRHLRDRARASDYLMGDASGKGFWSEIWREDIMEFESGEFSIIYQGRYYNFKDVNNLVDRIRNVLDED